MKKTIYIAGFIGILVGVYFLTLSFAGTDAVLSAQTARIAAVGTPSDTATDAGAPVEIVGGSDTGSSTMSSSTIGGRIRVSKFKGSDYEQHAVVIAPEPLSTAAKEALAGFDMQSAEQGDTTKITLTAKNNAFQSLTYVLTPGDTLYFVETSGIAIVVDKDGYIVD